MKNLAGFLLLPFSLKSLRHETDLRPLKNVVDGEWDLTTRLEAAGSSEQAAVLVNRLLEKLESSMSSIAELAMDLAQVAPELSKLAQSQEKGARSQAAQARDIAEYGKEMAASARTFANAALEAEKRSVEVGEILNSLQESTRNLGKIVSMMEEISFQAKIVSLNAGIEAARLGEEGVAFEVIAKEMRLLAGRASNNTHQIEAHLKGFSEQVAQATTAAGRQRETGLQSSNKASILELTRELAGAGREQEARTQKVSAGIRTVAELAQTQVESARQVNEMGTKVRGSCDDLLTAVGIFRLAAHKKACPIVEQLAEQPEMAGMNPVQLESALHRALITNPIFELLYITDYRGRQVTRNIAPADFTTSYASDGRGQDWSKRPWYLGVANKQTLYVSDIYRSVASNDFCITISAPIRNSSGEQLGVLGADINFRKLLTS